MSLSDSKKNFALIGAAGYVAPRHLQAIQATNNKLVAALDPSDSVGILDNYFPKASFFTEFERFDRHLEKLKRQGTNIDYLSVCSPNYLHDAHIRFGLRIGADVICEKPLVLNPWNLDALEEQESEHQRKIYSILQLRLHPRIIALKEKVQQDNSNKIYEIDLTYITARGNWYYASWKGDHAKSGGITTNIGIHFFDMLIWIFGKVQTNTVHIHTHDRAAGYLELERARVRWFLSINSQHLPQISESVYRSIKVEDEAIEFTKGFIDLHTLSYQAILNGQGFRLSDTKAAIQLVHDIRKADATPEKEDKHSLANLPSEKHPFEGR